MIQTQEPQQTPEKLDHPHDDNDSLLTLLHETQADLERIIADNFELKTRLGIATKLLQQSGMVEQRTIELLGRLSAFPHPPLS